MMDRLMKAGRHTASARARAENIDHHVAARIRERRIMLGLSQQRLAERIGVTDQQAHKYETGTNRITAGRLPTIAATLGVEVSHFFGGLGADESPELPPRQRAMLGLARDFLTLPSRRHQEGLCQLARDLAGLDQRQAGLDGVKGLSAAGRPA
jgi:transcriptional regulator with XRE-family HTH domain